MAIHISWGSKYGRFWRAKLASKCADPQEIIAHPDPYPASPRTCRLYFRPTLATISDLSKPTLENTDISSDSNEGHAG